jgi:hypothetical protein
MYEFRQPPHSMISIKVGIRLPSLNRTLDSWG